jgi:PIN domain nuclease of toxin-antitoxin system
MLVAATDTHALLWYLYDDQRLSGRARSFLDDATEGADTVAVSSITPAEIVYLVEKRRVPPQSLERVLVVLRQGAPFVEIPVDRNVVRSMVRISRRDVPDLPDRIIAATALRLGVPLISRDGRIRLSSVPTIW